MKGRKWGLLVAACMFSMCGCAGATESTQLVYSEEAWMSENTERSETMQETGAPSEDEVAIEDIEIVYEHNYTETGEVATISAKSKDSILWSFSTMEYEVAQIDRISYHGECNGYTYLYVDGHMTAYNVRTGEMVWKTDDVVGGTASVFDEAGNLYVVGYFGPDLAVISPDGSVLKRVTEFDASYYWPYAVSFVEGKLQITYECSEEEEEGGILSIDPQTWNFEKIETQ